MRSKPSEPPISAKTLSQRYLTTSDFECIRRRQTDAGDQFAPGESHLFGFIRCCLLAAAATRPATSKEEAYRGPRPGAVMLARDGHSQRQLGNHDTHEPLGYSLGVSPPETIH
jgi:hypothetical protein